MIVFEKVRFKNFLSYGNNWTELELNKHKDTLIVGENGAGKSTFLDALSYGLYMKPFRKVNNPQLVNSINKKHLKVEVEFSVGGNHYKVCRGHAPRTFEVYQNGDLLNQDAHTKDYQKILEQNILKMNYKSFTQIVVLGSRNFVPFMQLSTNDRRTVIEDLLDIQIFSTMAALLKDKIAENRTDLQDIEYKINLLEEKMSVQQEYIDKVNQDKDAQVLKIQNQINEKTVEVENLVEEQQGLLEQARLVAEQAEPLETVSAKIQQYLALENQIESKLNKLKKQLKFYEENDDCETCGQEIQHDFKEKQIENSNTAISETTSGLKQLEQEIAKSSSRVEELRTLKNEADELSRAASNKGSTAAAIEEIIESLQNELDEIQVEAGEDGQAKTKLTELSNELEEVQKRKVDVRRSSAIYNTAQILLKDTGIKARIIKQYVPVINKLINKYLAAMEFFVDFHLDEDFKETIRSRHRDDFAYASFSEGEKMRIDLSLLFTWRAIAKLKNSASTNILIMDEIFDSSLDSSGTEEFLKIIKELTSDTNIIIISHKTDQLLDKFSNVVRFEKHKNFSRIAE
jgi:DNA repair exonuclease SbcCD ATPase subunit